MRVTDGVYQAADVHGGPVLLVDDEDVTLVDAGDPGDEEKILALVDEAGRGRSELRRILLTHSDGDHIGALAALVDATGARVYAHPTHAAVIEGRSPSRSGVVVERPVHVDELVHDGDVLPIHGGLRVIETPGHTAGHVSFLLERDNLLLAGDCLSNTEGLGSSKPQYTDDRAEAWRTVEMLADLEPDSIVFGHGPPLLGDAAGRLRALVVAS
jgi:glyoxylase-like metal-dependent hydrolase (beta-lactamase superfamily II)